MKLFIPLILLFVLGLLLSRYIRYIIGCYRSNHWPTTSATIQKGALGRISLGKGDYPASFLGYAYIVQGIRYAGFFVLYGDKALLTMLHETLPGASLQIRYDPKNPNISYLVDTRDSRFQALTASQDPVWLNQAPAFDLQDALRCAPPTNNSPRA